LVILLIGKQVGVLDTAMFTMMVVMALVTTIMTGPLLSIVYPPKAVQRDIEAAERAALGGAQTYRVLVLADSAPNALTDRMLQLADAALAGRQPGEILLSRFLEADDTTTLEVGSGGLPDLAGLAEAVEGLKRYLAGVTVTTSTIRPLCRFSSGGGDDLLRQVESTETDVVVISEDWVRRHPEAFDALDGVLVMIVPAESPSVWLQSGSSPAVAVADQELIARDDGTATGARAVVVAARAALKFGRALSVVVADGDSRTPRRLQRGLEPLEPTGVVTWVGQAGECAAIDEGGVLAAARVEDRVGRSEVGLRDDVSDVVDQLQPRG
jgi:hypothetical protein